MSKKPKTDRAGVRRRVLPVEGHALTRLAVANTINHCSGLEICGMARSATHAFDVVKRLRPDIVVSEIMRPHDLGFIQELHRRHPRLPVLVFSIQDEELYAAPAREAGACGYLMKSAGANQLIRSIRTSLRRWRATRHGAASGNGANRRSGRHVAALSMKTTGRSPVRRPRRRETKRSRILIVNGVAIWREALTKRINRSRDLQVCGEALGDRAAFETVRRLRPSLVLTEILRPQDLGFIRKLHRRHRRLPILVFSFRDEEAYAPQALVAGARGYLMKNVDGDTLVAGIRKVLSGRIVLSPVMAARMRRDSQ